MGEEGLEEKCGVFLGHTLHDVYSGIKSLQHRGRGFAGIAAMSEERIDIIKWIGTVSAFDVADMHKILPAINHYHLFMGHVRYPTKGKKESIEEAHPHFIGGHVLKRPGHMLALDCDMAIVHNGQIDPKYLESVDKSGLMTTCDSEELLHYYSQYGEKELLKNIPLAYTLAIFDKKMKEAIVIRDRTGIKPGSIGWKDGKHQASSEDRAFTSNGGKPIKEMNPGSVYYFDINGDFRREDIVKPVVRFCEFEFDYAGHHESCFMGRNVNSIRDALGEQVGLEFIEQFPKINLDFVSYLPRCPEPAARGFSRGTGIPFTEVFYKIRAERSFQGPNKEERSNSIKKNLNLTPEALEILPGKTIAIIDDSIVRGTNIKKARQLLYEEAKVKEAYFISYTNPIGIFGEDGLPRGCEYGVDMPIEVDNPAEEGFIARDYREKRNRTFQEISEIVKMPIFYISKEGKEKVYKEFGLRNLCSFCFGGEKPFND